MIEKIKEFFKLRFADDFVRDETFRDQYSVYVRKENIVAICRALQSDPDLSFVLLSDICSLDWKREDKTGEERFEIIYNLYSLNDKFRFFLKVRLPENDPAIDSVSAVWHAADWLEREVYDLMGIIFTGHPDLRKIVTPDELDGFPLRKDFPLTYEVPQFSFNKDEPPEVIL